MERALGLRTSDKLDEQCTLIKTLHATWSVGQTSLRETASLLQRRGLWFHVILVRISAYVVTAPPEVGRNLREIYEEGRELENYDDIDVLALSVLHGRALRACMLDCL